MGSQSSKLGPESMVGSKREYAINFITSNTSGNNSKSGMENRLRKDSESGSTKDQNLVNTSFKWGYGGMQVMVTGTFTGWKDHVPLQKVGNEFNTIVRLPRGVYFYKFIVDGEWKFSPDDPTAPDEHGNINNVIDTTNIDTVNTIMGSKNDMKKAEEQVPSKPTVAQSPFNEDAPVLPPHLMGIYFLNEREKKIKEENSLSKDFGKMDLEEDKKKAQKKRLSHERDYVVNKNELTPPTHVTINHIGTFGSTNNSGDYNVTVMTQRFKSKYATIKLFSSRYTQAQ